MRVFVIGASGAIGTRLVPQLIDRGHEVIGTLRSPRNVHRPRVDPALSELAAGLRRRRGDAGRLEIPVAIARRGERRSPAVGVWLIAAPANPPSVGGLREAEHSERARKGLGKVPVSSRRHDALVIDGHHR